MIPVYVMLGCGEIGYLLLERESRFTILDVEGDTLREKGYTAVQGDPGKRDALKRIGIEKAEVVVVLDKGLPGLDIIRELNPEAFILCVVEKDEAHILYAKADCIVPSSLCVADECLYQIRQYEKRKRKKALEDILRSGKKMAVILHDNPDPDCISSALSLKLIGEKMGVASDLFYGGQIGYSENRVLVELLEVELVSPDSNPDFTGYDLSAFVDHSPWDYTSIARDVNPDIVIDHHILPEYKGKFVDVRENVGSTSVILVEYMQLFGVEIDSKLATGLFYGLLVDTDSFRRGICAEDIEALKVLRRKMDTDLLSQVERSEFPRGVKRSHIDADFLSVLGEAVKNMRMKGRVVFSSVGKVKYRDAVSNSADYLLKLEKVDIVVVYGVIGGSVYISARSFNGKLHMGKMLREAFQGL
ncbi:MAG: DHH family phosphoesterase, partial [Theionarchaea archaeon]|nr:DHH family phosphoesterase [Theionarchaea archaeon]